LISGERIEALRLIDTGENYTVKTHDGIKIIPKKDVKEVLDAH
jgi:hypothetical protein